MFVIRSLIFILIALAPTLLFGDAKDSIAVIQAEFSENKGQWPQQVRFKAPLGNGNLWIEETGLRFDLYNADELETISHANRLKNPKLKPPKKIKRHNYYLKFVNSNPNAKVIGSDVLFEYENYFIGNDRSKWASNINKYQNIEYQSIYTGINLQVYSKSGHIKWDFIIEPNADPNKILIEYEGVDNLKLKRGNLHIKTSVNTIIESKPIAYQLNNNGDTINIECDYILNDNILSFHFPKSYNKDLELVIDPTLVFATYSGSLADNWGFTATYDSKGFLYAGGIVFGSGYPTTIGALDTTFSGAFDVGITKYDTTGSFLIYSTYLGGSAGEVPASLVVNSNDELFVFGTTSSLDFSTTIQGYDTSYNGGTNTTISSSINFANGSDLFISHLSFDGTQLLGSTYLGGSNNDGINSSNILINNYGDDIRGEIIMDKNNNVYVVSTSQSSNFPTTANVFQGTKGLQNDGIIAKLDNSLSNLIWASFFGGSGDDAIYGVKVSKKQDIYITGGSTSSNIATTNGVYQTTYQGGGADGFIAKISKTGFTIIFCTYLGSSDYDQSYLIDLDKYDNVYVFGQTKDTTNVFIYNAIWNSPKDGQFITKLMPSLATRAWSTTWGNGTAGIDIAPSAFMVDLCNRVYLSAWGGAVNATFAGGTTHNLPITTNAMQSSTDGSDYYLMVMTDDASALDYGSFFGGSTSAEHVDGGTSRFDNKGRIYQNVCAGCGGNHDFPTTVGAHSITNNSNNCNNGVFKVDFNIPAIVADYIIPPVVCLPDTSFFVNTSFLSHPSLTQYSWNFGDGNTSTLASPNHIYSQSGVYDAQLIIYDPQSCNIRDTIIQQVVVLSGNVDTLLPQYVCPGNTTQIGILPVNDTSVHFSWTPTANLSNSFISNPFASPINTTWYKMVMTNNLCADTFHQLVEVINLIADAGNDTSICQNSITLTGSGNYSNLNFHWSSNQFFTDTLNNYPNDSSVTHTFTNPKYLYFQIDRDGCSDYDSVFIDQRIVINPTQVQNPLCHGDSNGSIFVNVIGGANPISYQWGNGQNSNPIINLPAGNYSLTVTDADGCFNTLDTALIEPDLLVSNSALKNIPCQTACIGRAWANPQGGTPPYQWQWDDPSNQAANPAFQLCDGTYHVTLTDANNCITYDTIIIIDSSIYINFQAWADRDTIYEGEQFGLHSTQLGNGYTYTWTPATGLSDPNISNPTASPLVTTTYIVEVHDIYGCSWQDTITIFVIDVICDEPFIYVPNAFTPNGDGKNDVIFVKSSVGWDLQFMIYDKWGELVFETQDINQSWDGTYKGQKLTSEVYVYHLKLTCYNREVFIKKGNITLIR